MSSDPPHDHNPGEYGSQYVSSLQQKFVTAQDFAQFQRFFSVLEERAKRALAIKAKQIQDLQGEIDSLNKSLDQQSRQTGVLGSQINAAKGKLKQYGVETSSNDLLELIDGYYQLYSVQLRSRLEENRKLEARIGELELERKQWKSRCEQYMYKLDDLRQILLADEKYNTNPDSQNIDLVDLLEERLSSNLGEIREKDSIIGRLSGQLKESQMRFEEKSKVVEKLSEEKKDTAEKIRMTKEIIYSSPVPGKFLYIAPAQKGSVIETDIVALVSKRDQDMMEELNARDQNIFDTRKKVKELEDSLVMKANEGDKTKRELIQYQSDRKTFSAQIESLNEQLRNHITIIHRQNEELENRRIRMDSLGRDIKTLTEELEDKKVQLELIEGELQIRDEQIANLQRKIAITREEMNEKVVILSLILERLKEGKEEINSIDEELFQLSDRLDKVLDERLKMEDSLRKLRDEEFTLIQENRDALSQDAEYMGLSRERSRDGASGTGLGLENEDDELGNLFSTARRSLMVLGEKASFSYAALKTKDDLDAVYNEQLTVTSFEMALRDKKNHLMDLKIRVSEKLVEELLRVVEQRSTYTYTYTHASARSSFRREKSVKNSNHVTLAWLFSLLMNYHHVYLEH